MSQAMANLNQQPDIIQMDRWPILVVYSPAIFTEEELKNHLEQLLGCRVEPVTPDALRESMKPQTLEEAIYVAPAMDPT